MEKSSLLEMLERWAKFEPGMKEYFVRAIEELEKDREEMKRLALENVQSKEYTEVLERQLELVVGIMKEMRGIDFPTYIKKELKDGIL